MSNDKKKQADNNPGYKVASLFAGIGGFCRVFERQGFNVKWANEIDGFARDTPVVTPFRKYFNPDSTLQTSAAQDILLKTCVGKSDYDDRCRFAKLFASNELGKDTGFR